MVYNILGPGLLESVYKVALCHQFRKDGLLLRSVLHKIGCISAIEASFIAFDLHNLCVKIEQ